MNEHVHQPGSSRRRALIAVGLALGVAAVVAAGSVTGSAQAGLTRPAITVNTVSPTIGVTLPPLTLVTVPPLTLSTVPPFTLVTVPGSTDETTTVAETTTTETTTTLETTTSTTSTTVAPVAGPSGPVPDSEFTVVIDRAEVACDGTIHVEYSTTADPPTAALTNHIVMVNPTDDPAAFTVVETAANPANGSFVFDGPGAPDRAYRVFVIGLLDPIDPDGQKAIDQADVAVVQGC